jgi:hypothetical protein
MGPVDDAPSYIRFVCFRLVDGQKSRLGVFQALDDARDSDLAPDWALGQLRDLRLWFNDNLDAPGRFSRGTRRGDGQQALSWFKGGAVEHIRKMFALKAALQACGIHVEVIRTRDPGHILYEDRFQVAAEPQHRRF